MKISYGTIRVKGLWYWHNHTTPTKRTKQGALKYFNTYIKKKTHNIGRDGSAVIEGRINSSISGMGTIPHPYRKKN